MRDFFLSLLEKFWQCCDRATRDDDFVADDPHSRTAASIGGLQNARVSDTLSPALLGEVHHRGLRGAMLLGQLRVTIIVVLKGRSKQSPTII